METTLVNIKLLSMFLFAVTTSYDKCLWRHLLLSLCQLCTIPTNHSEIDTTDKTVTDAAEDFTFSKRLKNNWIFKKVATHSWCLNLLTVEHLLVWTVKHTVIPICNFFSCFPALKATWYFQLKWSSMKFCMSFIIRSDMPSKY